MSGSLQIGKVLGIRIRLRFSWAFIFFFIAWSLASFYLPDMFPEWSRAGAAVAYPT